MMRLNGQLCNKKKCPLYRSFPENIYDGNKYGRCIASKCIEITTPLLDIWLEEFSPLIREGKYHLLPKEEGC